MTKDRENFFRIIRLSIAITLLWYLFTLVNFNNFLEIIKNVKLWSLIIIVLMYPLNVYISTLKWNGFLKYYKIIYSKSELFYLYLISGFFNNFLPTSIGGDSYKYLRLTKKYPTLNKEILSSMILERGVGFFALFAMNIILIPCFTDTILNQPIFLGIELLIAAIFLLMIILLCHKNKTIKCLEKINIKIKLFQKFKNFIKTLTSINDKKILINSFCYSIIFIILGAFSAFLLFYALGVQVNILYIILACSITNIFGVLPISLNSIGVTEGLFVLLFGFYGIETEISLAAAIIARALMIAASSSGGFVYLFKTLKYYVSKTF